MAAMFSNLDLHASHVLMLDTKALDALGPANPFTLHTICAGKFSFITCQPRHHNADRYD